MAKLGEAYIRVRADLAPFEKDLDRSVKRITDRLEKSLDKSLGKKLGVNLGSGAREGISESLAGIDKDIDKTLSVPANRAGRTAGKRFKKGFSDELDEPDIITKSLASLISALEDGFSALPVQAKAAVGGALLATLVPAAAAAGAAAGTALVGAIAAGGTALAFQFEAVEIRGQEFVDDLRYRLVRSANAFGHAAIAAMDLFEQRLEDLDPVLRNLFDEASRYVMPLVDGVTRGLSGVIQGLSDGLSDANFEEWAEQIVRLFEEVGYAVGEAFYLILSNDNLPQALSDLTELLVDLVIAGGEFVSWAMDTWATVRPVVQVLYEAVEVVVDLVDALISLTQTGRDAKDIMGEFAQIFSSSLTRKSIHPIGTATIAMGDFTGATQLALKATDEETKKLDEMRRAFDLLTKATHDAISSETDYRRSILDTKEHLDEYGGSLSKNNKHGLDLIDLYDRQITKLGEFVRAQVEAGEMTNEEAQEYYDKEIARIRAEHKERGGNIKQFDELFGKYAELAGLPPIPPKTAGLLYATNLANTAVQNLIANLNAAGKAAKLSGNIKVPGGTQIAYADGGFVTEPTSAILGENYRPELVLPLTQPSRSMSLLAQSPLSGALGGSNMTVYAVFDGEPFQARMVKTANAVNRKAARTINHVPRSV